MGSKKRDTNQLSLFDNPNIIKLLDLKRADRIVIDKDVNGYEVTLYVQLVRDSGLSQGFTKQAQIINDTVIEELIADVKKHQDTEEV
jgi:hypothetical protein